jgi:hypothetical protein
VSQGTSLKREGYKWRVEEEEDDVSSYWMALRKREGTVN